MDEIPVVPDHISPVRFFEPDLEPLTNFQEAKACADAVVIMEGDWGGQIYLVCPVHLITCNEAKLRKLLVRLDKIAWACNEGEGAGVYFERRQPGEGVSGGMGGGLVTEGIWVHPNLAGHEKEIRNALGIPHPR